MSPVIFLNCVLPCRVCQELKYFININLISTCMCCRSSTSLAATSLPWPFPIHVVLSRKQWFHIQVYFHWACHFHVINLSTGLVYISLQSFLLALQYVSTAYGWELVVDQQPYYFENDNCQLLLTVAGAEDIVRDCVLAQFFNYCFKTWRICYYEHPFSIWSVTASDELMKNSEVCETYGGRTEWMFAWPGSNDLVLVNLYEGACIR